MHYLTRYYKNLCETLQEQLNYLENKLNEQFLDDRNRLLDQLKQMDDYRARKEQEAHPLDPTKTRKQYDDDVMAGAMARKKARDNYENLPPSLGARARYRAGVRAQMNPAQQRGEEVITLGQQNYGDLTSFVSLSPEDQDIVLPSLGSSNIRGMLDSQRRQSQYNVNFGRADKPVGYTRDGSSVSGAPRVSALNKLSSELDDRKSNAMGGRYAAQSFARSWSEDPTSERTQRSMSVRTPKERVAMTDALEAEGRRIMKEKGTKSPEWRAHIQAVNEFGRNNPNDKIVPDAFKQQPQRTNNI